jgi:hypothetical protein
MLWSKDVLRIAYHIWVHCSTRSVAYSYSIHEIQHTRRPIAVPSLSSNCATTFTCSHSSHTNTCYVCETELCSHVKYSNGIYLNNSLFMTWKQRKLRSSWTWLQSWTCEDVEYGNALCRMKLKTSPFKSKWRYWNVHVFLVFASPSVQAVQAIVHSGVS